MVGWSGGDWLIERPVECASRWAPRYRCRHHDRENDPYESKDVSGIDLNMGLWERIGKAATFVSFACALCEFLNTIGRIILLSLLLPPIPGKPHSTSTAENVSRYWLEFSILFVFLGMASSLTAIFLNKKYQVFPIVGLGFNLPFLGLLVLVFMIRQEMSTFVR